MELQYTKTHKGWKDAVPHAGMFKTSSIKLSRGWPCGISLQRNTSYILHFFLIILPLLQFETCHIRLTTPTIMWRRLHTITCLPVETGEFCAPQLQRIGRNIYWIFVYHEIIFNQRSVTFSKKIECEKYTFPRKLSYTNHIYHVLETNVLRKNSHSPFKSQSQSWNTLQDVSTMTNFLLYV